MSTDLHGRLLDATGPLIAGTVLSTANVNGPRAALRAVVELHEPGLWPECTGCTPDQTGVLAAWPCSTIQVIAEQLGVPIDKSITEKEERRD